MTGNIAQNVHAELQDLAQKAEQAWTTDRRETDRLRYLADDLQREEGE